ncbi:uncharacterized protein LOC135080054 [Ostrinia nubilalis]|uniref:uncharacterized protein LOC135080054 n=1 Tax=Ostrinia nubilalis TaxID=29057 RepID=UPI0030822D51
MKFFAVFAAVCAVASAAQGWTLPQLSSAVTSPITDAAFKPVLMQALDHVMENIFSGLEGPISIQTSEGVSGFYNLRQLEAALLNPSIHPVFVPHIEDAFNKLISAVFAGEDVQTIALMVPALEFTYMTLSELDVALSSPATNPALVPYLEHAGNVLIAALFGGQDVDGIVVAFPAGLGAIGGVAPSPVEVAEAAPVVPGPVVVPAPVVTGPPASSSSPLVQIILNVQNSQDVGVVGSPVIPSPIVVPGPIAVQPIPGPNPPIAVQPIPIIPSPSPVAPNPIPGPIAVQPIPVIPSPSPVAPNPIPSPIAVQPIPV